MADPELGAAPERAAGPERGGTDDRRGVAKVRLTGVCAAPAAVSGAAPVPG